MYSVCLEWTVKDLARELYPPSGDTGTGKVHRTRFRGPVTVTDYGLFPIIDRPTVYIDRDGVVIAWYLPGLFGRALNVGLCFSFLYHTSNGTGGQSIHRGIQGWPRFCRERREQYDGQVQAGGGVANADPHV